MPQIPSLGKEQEETPAAFARDREINRDRRELKEEKRRRKQDLFLKAAKLAFGGGGGGGLF